MTAPVIGLTHVIGYYNPQGIGVRHKIKKSAIQALVVTPWESPIYGADGMYVGMTPLRYAVMAVPGAQYVAARVADFATEAEAQTYANNDPNGVLA